MLERSEPPFSAPLFSAALQGRTIVMSGDSIMRQLWTALVCQLWSHNLVTAAATDHTNGRGAIPVDVANASLARIKIVPYAVRIGASGYVFFGKMNLHGTLTRSLETLASNGFRKYVTASEHARAVELGVAKPPSPPSADAQLGSQDVTFINMGIHFPPHTHYKLLGETLTKASAARRDGRGSTPQIVYVETPPAHFPTATGAYEEGAQNDTSSGCTNHLAVSVDALQPGKSLQANERKLVRATALSLLQTYAALAPVGSAHIGGKTVAGTHVLDCSHWCLPGALDAAVLPSLQVQLDRIDTGYED